MKEKKSEEPIKVTDKRIFTADGDIKEEFRGTIAPADPALASRPAEPPAAPRTEPPPAAPPPPTEEKQDRRKMRDKAESPGTPFSSLVELFVGNAYMALGLLPDQYGQRGRLDLRAAKEMIDILGVLQEKTKGNLTEDEADHLETFLGELKLHYVRQNKGL